MAGMAKRFPCYLGFNTRQDNGWVRHCGLSRLEDFNSAFAISDCVALGKLVISASDSSGARLVDSSSRERISPIQKWFL